MQLILDDIFTISYFEIIERLIQFYQISSNIFHAIQDPTTETDDQASITDRKKTEIVRMTDFEAMSLLSKINQTYVKHIIDQPVRLDKLDINHSFLTLLRTVYEREYPETTMILPGARSVIWYMKLTFTDP